MVVEAIELKTTRGPVNIYEDARPTVHGRGALVARVAAGERISHIAQAVGVSRQTVYKWCARARRGSARRPSPEG